MYRTYYLLTVLYLALIYSGCSTQSKVDNFNLEPDALLDYTGVPDSSSDRSMLVFSDQGAWFGYSIPEPSSQFNSFSGPFLMTQENGKWLSKAISEVHLIEDNEPVIWEDPKKEDNAYSSHLEITRSTKSIALSQTLFYANANEAIIIYEIENSSDLNKLLSIQISGDIILKGIRLKRAETGVTILSEKSDAIGLIELDGSEINDIHVEADYYKISLNDIPLESNSSFKFIMRQSFRFKDELSDFPSVKEAEIAFDKLRITKKDELRLLLDQSADSWSNEAYQTLLAKSALTLQNNWRAPAGELKHAGLFPSYHYKWFHGFWAWDSWKHAAALAHFKPQLAKDQIRGMYDFQDTDGFIPDCIFRDTTIENHNYRDTKPPLSAWAVWKIYELDKDLAFVKEIYPQLVLQHNWWYKNRDHDLDGLCEYGSTDGSIVAAKWESGMDNAVRFDSSKLLMNRPGAFSLDQESVDLNAYLYAEKIYLADLAKALRQEEDHNKLMKEADRLKKQIQEQFYDSSSGWFYDTNLAGNSFIKAMGSEGWIPLWANVASEKQARAIHDNMMLESTFNGLLPLQTISANHPLFKPERGYWRGPMWLDQAYFGITGLRNYGYRESAKLLTEKLISNAEGVLEKGKAIRENYNPVTGEGLEAYNFSWSAAHYILLLLEK